MAFAPLFLAHAGCVGASFTTEELEARLSLFWREGRARWPELPLPAEALVRHLALHFPRMTPGDELGAVLERFDVGGLYLACGCVEGLPAALAAFERHHMAAVPAMLSHMRLPAAMVDEVRQQLRERLLVRTDVAPRIAEYSGRGSLANWVRVVALRTALSLLRKSHEPSPPSDAFLALLPAPAPDPELETIQRRFHDEFRRALEDAFAILPAEHRYLLRLHFVDRLSTPKLGTLFGVNQSTISRWLRSAQQAVHDETRRLLKERLDLSSQEFTSALRTLESQLHLSLTRILDETIHPK